MTEKVRLKLRTNGDITRVNEVVTIAIAAGAGGRDFTALMAEDNARIAGDDNAAGDGTGDLADSFHDKTWATNASKGDIHSVSLNCGDEETAEKVLRLLALKREIGTNLVLNIIDIVYKTQPVGGEVSKIGYAGHVLTLDKDSYVNGDFDPNVNFSINDLAENNYSTITTNYDAQTAKLVILETLLSTLKTEYATDLKGKDEIQADIDKINVYKNATNTAIEGQIFALDYPRAGNHKVYQKQANDWFYFLTEAKKWVEYAGFNKVEQILKANANGFILERTWNLMDGFVGVEMNYGTNCPLAITDVNAPTEIKDGKYKGFDITEGAKIINVGGGNSTFDPGNLYTKNKDSREIFGKRAEVNKARYKLAIGRFRTNTAAKGFGHADFKDISDPKELRGFQPGDIAAGDGKHTTVSNHDITEAAKDHKLAENGYETNGDVKGALTDKYANEDLTKKCFEILDLGVAAAVNLDDLIRKAFTQNDFAETKKTPKEHLDFYWSFIRTGSLTNLIYTTSGLNYDGAKKLKAAQTNPAGDDKVKIEALDRLEAAHEYAEEFIGIYFGVDPDKAGLVAWKGRAEKFTKSSNFTSEEKDIKEFNTWDDGGKRDSWSVKMLKKIIEVETKVNKPDIPDQKELTPENQTELTSKMGSAKDPAKKIYTAFDGLGKDKKTDNAYTALKGLINKLETTSSWDNEPKSLRRDYENSTTVDNKTAWEFVNEQTKDDAAYKNSKGWADHVAKTKEAVLTTEIATAKGKMTGESGADAAIGMDSQESISLVKEIGNLFELCKKVYDGKVSSSDLEDAKKDLIAFRDTAGEKKEAWGVVNKYKNKDSKEYATEALVKASKKKEERDKKFEDGLKLTTVSAVKEFYDKNTNLDKEDRSRTEIFIALKDESGEGKSLREIFGKKSVSEYSEEEDKLDENIGLIQKHIDLINKIIKAKSTDTDEAGKIKKKLEEIKSTDSKFDIGILESWKNKLEARKKVLETKKNEENTGGGNKTPEGKSWYKEWWGILLIIVIVAAVLGGIAWLIKANSSEEGEGEGE